MVKTDILPADFHKVCLVSELSKQTSGLSSYPLKDPKYLKDVAELLAEEWEARTAAGQITFSFGNFKSLDQTKKRFANDVIMTSYL